jgi:hypothetical protein
MFFPGLIRKSKHTGNFFVLAPNRSGLSEL